MCIRDSNYELRVLKAVEAVNKDQKMVIYNKIMNYFDGDIPVSYTHLTLPTSDLV